MRVGTIVQLVERVGAVPDGCADRDVLKSMLADLRRLKSWVQAGEVRATKLMAAISSFPEHDVAEGSGSSVTEAAKIAERATVTDNVPELADQLAEGNVTGEHVDVVGQALRDLTVEQRERLLEQMVTILEWAQTMPTDRFRRKLAALVRRLDTTAGQDRLDRQQRATRLRMWVDQASGMGRIVAEFDPVTYLSLHSRIEAMLATLFAESVPDTCPTDPRAKQAHLRALALTALIDGQSGGKGRPEVIAVVDTRCSDSDGPVVDWGLPVEIPHRVLVDLFDQHDLHVYPVVVRNGVILYAPGELDLGRTTRVANRAQRRALRASYPTCAIPGCDVLYEYCKIHHIIWWRHGGLTDLANLIPVCVRHHHNIHDNGWQLTLTPDRQLIVDLPDGTRLSTGPPKRQAA